MLNRASTVCCLVFAAALSAACDDLPAGPGGLEALAAEAETAAAGLSLRDLFAAALFRVQRDEGTDSALSVLGRWRSATDDGAVDSAREIEAGTVLRVFGDDVVAQAASVLAGELREADLAATRLDATGDAADMNGIRGDIETAAASIERARIMSAEAPTRALVELDEASAALASLRLRLVAAADLPTLETLYRKALDQAGDAAAAARLHEAELSAAVDSARESASIEDRYRAQEALRAYRAEFAVQILGKDVGGNILEGVGDELARLKPALDSLDRAGLDVARDRRMADAAAAIADRAGAALRDGDAVRAVDLAAHAAGLVDELRRRRIR